MIDYLDQNMKKIKGLNKTQNILKKKLSVLNDLKILLNNYFERTEENTDNSEQKVNNNILEDQKLMTIMNKIQSFNSDKNKDENDKKNSQNNLGVNILDNVKSTIRSKDNNKNNNTTPHKTDKEKEKAIPAKTKIKTKKMYIMKMIKVKNIIYLIDAWKLLVKINQIFIAFLIQMKKK